MLVGAIVIILFYYIWKKFADLAFRYNHKKWVFGALGIVVYYAGTAIVGIIIGFLSGILDFVINWENDLLMSIIALPFGLATCYGTYYFLEKKWEKEVVVMDSIDDIGKITED